ncbi:MAG: transcriptional regulator [Corynebacterium variabile]
MDNTFTARASRDEGWWTVTVDEVPGLFTQTRRLDQIPGMVLDALTLFPDITEDAKGAEVTVVPQGPAADAAHEAAELRNLAREAQEQATASMQAAARELSAGGLTFRDIGSLLGVSYQQAQKLAVQ